MAHTTRNKTKLLSRVHRIRGQVEALERALDADSGCAEILQLVAACRGALNSLMAELIEGHVRFHVLPPSRKNHNSQMEAAEQLLDVVRTYLK
jgi:DNA-binding FrmR family transcriptional regulator